METISLSVLGTGTVIGMILSAILLEVGLLGLLCNFWASHAKPEAWRRYWRSKDCKEKKIIVILSYSLIALLVLFFLIGNGD